MPLHDVPHVSETQPRVRRSLFANYPTAADVGSSEGRPGDAPVEGARPVRRELAEYAGMRCFLCQFLARALGYPEEASWTWVTSRETRDALRVIAELPLWAGEGFRGAARAVADALVSEAFGGYHDAYVSAIGHAARGSCPINEIEYGDLGADPLLQPHRLADLAAFYRAFGMELVGDGGERQDHLGVELEFLAVLCGQEAHALEQHIPDDLLEVNLDAQRRFLREHLGRWSITFARRLESVVADEPLRTVARFLAAFVEEECRRAGVHAGGTDVALRPADTEASLCDSCGIRQALPGGQPRMEE